jgi:hypothetical protein
MISYKKKLRKDNKAIMELPFNLVIIVVVMGAVILILSISLLNIMHEAEISQINGQINLIVSEAEHMAGLADSGSNRTITVKFPYSLKWIVFGKPAESMGDLKQSSYLIPEDLTLSSSSSNYFHYLLEDGTIETGNANTHFCGKNSNEAALIHGGEHTLWLELISENGKSFVKIVEKN